MALHSKHHRVVSKERAICESGEKRDVSKEVVMWATWGQIIQGQGSFLVSIVNFM